MIDTELRSALIVAVPEAVSSVDEWRERTSHAKPSSGVPPHVTILSPFAPPASIDSSLVDDLRALLGAFESFAFELDATGRFPDVLLQRLPIRAEAREVLLIEEVEPDSARWRIRVRLPLRTA